jgi:hypothetical protein
MTEPAELKGAQETVRVRDDNGVIAASFQVAKFPPIEVTGVSKDGNMLLISIGHHAKPPVIENGAPIWVVLSLTPDGNTMKLAQMMERSATVKRGIGTK